jgi:hypothetical protein
MHVSPPASDARHSWQESHCPLADMLLRSWQMKLLLGISACIAASCAMWVCLFQGVSLAQPSAYTATRVKLSVAPIPTTANPSPGTPQVSWSTGDGSPGQVTVTPEGAKEVLFTSASEGTASAPWIAPGHTYVFKLYSTTSGRRLLARLKVGHAPALTIVAIPTPPRRTSALVDRLLQIFAFGSVVLLALLTAMHVREARSDG